MDGRFYWQTVDLADGDLADGADGTDRMDGGFHWRTVNLAHGEDGKSDWRTVDLAGMLSCCCGAVARRRILTESGLRDG
jgi:hypothetical protein